MRKSTKSLEAELRKAVAADEKLANRVDGLTSFCDRFARAAEDWRGAMIKDVNDFTDRFLAELRVLNGDLCGVRSELRGEPNMTVIEGGNREKLEDKSGEQGTV